MTKEQKIKCLEDMKDMSIKISELMVEIDMIPLRMRKHIPYKPYIDVHSFTQMERLLSNPENEEHALFLRVLNCSDLRHYSMLIYEVAEYIRFLKNSKEQS